MKYAIYLYVFRHEAQDMDHAQGVLERRLKRVGFPEPMFLRESRETPETFAVAVSFETEDSETLRNDLETVFPHWVNPHTLTEIIETSIRCLSALRNADTIHPTYKTGDVISDMERALKHYI